MKLSGMKLELLILQGKVVAFLDRHALTMVAVLIPILVALVTMEMYDAYQIP